MCTKHQRIAYLEGEIDELRKLKCTNDTLQLVKYCKEIEKIVNDPRFVPGSLKLMPRVTQADQCYEVASDVEIVIYAEHEYREPEREIAALKMENALLKTKIVQFAESVKK